MEKVKKIDIHAHATPFPQYFPKFEANECTMPSVETMLDFYDKLNIEKGALRAEDFPLLLHIDEIISAGKSVNIPWESFTYTEKI